MKNYLSKVRFFFVAVVFLSSVFYSCNFDSNAAESSAETNQFGSIRIVNKKNEDPSRAVYIPAIEKADVTVSGYGMTPIVIPDVDVRTGGGSVLIENIPSGKNRIVTVEAKQTIDSVLQKIDGIVIRNIVNIRSGAEKTVHIDWETTALGNVFEKLLALGYDISSLSSDEVQSLIPDGVNAALVDVEAIADHIKNGTSYSSYELKPGSVIFDTDIALSGAYAQVSDPASSKTAEITGAQQTVSNVAPGNWTFYIIDANGTILYSASVVVESDGSTYVNQGGKINLGVPAPRLEDSEGNQISDAISGSATIYLACRRMDGETPLDGAEIYYTLDGTDPLTSSDKQTYTSDGISVSVGVNLKAVGTKYGLQNSSVMSWTFCSTAAALGEKHPSSGPYSLMPVDTSANTGAHINSDKDATFALYSANATKVLLEIYDKPYGSAVPRYDYWMEKDSGNCWRAKVKEVPVGTIYAFRVWGPNWDYDASWTRGGSSAGFVTDVDESGNRFNPNKVLFDPYAYELTHDKSDPKNMSQNGSMADPGIFTSGEEFRNFDTASYAPKGYLLEEHELKWFDIRPGIPASQARIYEAHVRGISKHPSCMLLPLILKDVPTFDGFSGWSLVLPQYRGTYKGAIFLIPYLKKLGINTIELLPIHESDNDCNPDNGAGGNYWGYMTYGFFAPERRYSYDKSPGGPTSEFRQMVRAFHLAGIEVYLDVVYNHTGEGGTWKGTGDNYAQAELTSMRGIDNSTYYSLVEGSPGAYWETTGCGNNMQCDNPAVRKLITDSLSYWITQMGVDGFRFDLAPVLGREGKGTWNFNPNSATLAEIANLGSTHNVEMIAEAWDCQWPGGYRIGKFPQGWGDWNGVYRDVVRKYVGGFATKEDKTGDYVDYHLSIGNAIYGSSDIFGSYRPSVNMIDAHDGFTLADLSSYSGAGNYWNDKLSWPFGPSDGGNSDENHLVDTSQEASRRTARNYIALQMFTRGIPMIVWGDEFSRTQNGNNNAYNIDSVGTWSNYYMINSASPHSVSTLGSGSYSNKFGTFNNKKGINGNFVFMQRMLNMHSNPAFTQPSYDNPTMTWQNDNDGNDFTFGYHLAGSSVPDGNDFLMYSNMSGNNYTVNIPAPASGSKWVRICDTGAWAEPYMNSWDPDDSSAEEYYAVTSQKSYDLGAYSVLILKQVENSGSSGGSGGGSGGGSTMPDSINVTADDFTWEGNAKVFAWVWKKGDGGSWVSCTGSNKTVKFKLPAGCDRFILVRCPEKTTTPDWDAGGDIPGRIWNKTDDVTVNAGQSDYIVNFIKYDPPASGGSGGGTGGSSGGGTGGGSATPSNNHIKVTTTDQYTWINDAKVFAWVWKNGESGEWKECAKGGESVVEFDLPSECNMFLLVRCPKDTKTPSWNVQGDNPGRIYNKTADITVNPGQNEYTVTFTEYTPPSSGGGSSGGTPTGRKITVNADSWTWSNDVVVFASVWKNGEANSEKWVTCTGSGSTAKFVLESEKDRFLLVRCYKGTTEPGWQVDGHKVGRIYNKTADITVNPGQSEYTVTFEEYTPQPSGGGSGGGSSGGNTQPTNTKITVTADNWTWGNDVKVFAWVWKHGKEDDGKWVTCTGSGSEAKFDLEPGKDRFLLVRVHKDTTQPDWNLQGNKAGRIYNKTADITVIPGNTSYSAHFVEYTPTGGGSSGGGSSGGTPTGRKITVNADSWTWSNDVVVFAWVWKNGEQNGGKWVGCTGSGSTVKFELEAGRDRFVLVRAHKDTTTPDWNMQGDKAGRIYNKTADITVISGTNTYSANFVEYTPSGGSSGGGGSGGNTQPTNTKITVTADSWTWGNDVKVFAWVWKNGEQNGGKWVGCTGSGSTVKFELEAGRDRFVLVRAHKDTTTPDWNMQGDKAGRIYNKTADITVISGTNTYSANFVEYTPSSSGGSGGGSSGGGTQPTNTHITVNMTNAQSWLWGDNAKVFAWVWKDGDESGGKWVACTGSGGSAKFDLETGKNRFLVARCHKDTTQPNWNTGGENAGRIYNKTDDITFESGKTTYNVNLKDYTPTGGGSSGGGTQPTINKISVTADSWTWGNDVKVFAWVWKNGEQNGGKWVGCTGSGSTVKFELEAGRDRFVLVRAHKDTTTPDWNMQGDKAGRIYNKTADITVISGTNTYSANFVEYTPSSSGGSGGGSSGGNTQPTINKISVTADSWTWDGDVKVFAWVWKDGDTNSGKWIDCTKAGNAAEFELESGKNRFLLVRCYKTTTTPNWDMQGDNPGRIYSKTPDIKVIPGRKVYSTKFNDYTPSGGGSSGGSTTPTNTKITVNVDSWIWNDNAKVFAWVWKNGEQNGGKWVSCIKSGSAAKFDLEPGRDRFLLVRTHKGTAQPNWTTGGDNPGRIYNKTADITVKANQTTYSVSFVEYTPSGGGSGGGTQPTVTHITAKISNSQNWVWGDNAKVFAWVWKNGKNSEGKWVACTRSGNDAKFDLESGKDRFLLVRAHKGTSQPNWQVDGHKPGRIYNKTADMTVNGTQPTYNVSFVEYTPPSSGGGSSGGSTQPTVTKITANGNWEVWKDGAKIFAWVWKGSAAGSWKPCTGSGNTVKFDLPSGCTGFKLVRVPGSTSTPDWNGTIWNQTGNISVNSGQTTYNVTFN